MVISICTSLVAAVLASGWTSQALFLYVSKIKGGAQIKGARDLAFCGA